MLVARFYQIYVCGDDVDNCGEMRFAFMSDLFYTYELLATILYEFLFMLKIYIYIFLRHPILKLTKGIALQSQDQS